jgi:hypothetical protein
MDDRDRYSVDAARRAADAGELDRWVAEFLASPGSDNAELGRQLADAWLWHGPVEVSIHELHRLAGPPGDPVLCPVDDDWWRDDVEEMAEQVGDGWEPPPVVVTVRGGQMVLEDGNHRVEGLRQAGDDTTWAIVGVAPDPAADGRSRALDRG